MEYRPTIGLEIHAELKTRTKMFCDSLNDPDEKRPNQNVCPVCLAHPGALPTINKKAVEAVIQVGLALNGNINPVSKFDRKNYFYPDLPKGYQISQYDQPLVVGGELLRVSITRIHLEEDTGTLIHSDHSLRTTANGKVLSVGSRQSAVDSYSLVDFNRAGIPLMELVTEPDIHDAETAVKFGKELQLILRYLGVSDANMEKGQMRLEANISLREIADNRGFDEPRINADTISVNQRGYQHKSAILGTKVEVKNINSFRALKDAIEYEIKRQAEVLDNGAKVTQETRGWDDVKQKTFSQRLKEEAHDYRYFPEPDLPPFEPTKVFDIEDMKCHLPELPAQKRERFKKELKELEASDFSEEQIDVLVANKKMADYFEEVVSEISELCTRSNPRPADSRYITFAVYPNFLHNVIHRGYKYLVSNLQEYINSSGLAEDIVYKEFPPEQLANFVYLLEFGPEGFNENDISGKENAAEDFKMAIKAKLSGAQARGIFRKMLEDRQSFGYVIQTREFEVVSDMSELEKAVNEIIEKNQGAVVDYKKGKTASMQFLIGKAMAKLKGKGNPEILKSLFLKELEK